MVIPIRTHISVQVPAGLSKRGWRRLTKESFAATAEHWRTKIMPRHFRPGARGKYGYQPRKPGYRKQTERQRRRKLLSTVAWAIKTGRAIPAALNADLIYSGRLRAQMIELSAARGFPTRGIVSVPSLPGHAPERPKPGNSRPPVFEEATRLLPSERDELLDMLQSRIERGINQIVERKSHRTR